MPKYSKYHRGLSEAVLLGEVEAVKRLLEQGVDPNSCNNDGEAVLIGALFRPYEKIANLLLDYGADADCRHKDRTPLIFAASNLLPGLVRRLIELGAEADLPAGGKHDSTGETALMAAAGNQPAAAIAFRLREVLGLLVDAGADVDRRDHNGKTALLRIFKRKVGPGNVITARCLLDLEADPDARDLEGRSALMYAYHNILSYWFDEDHQTNTTSYETCRYSTQIADMLHEAGAEKEGLEVPYFFDVVARGNQKAVQKYVDAGHEVNVLDPGGYSVLGEALDNHELFRFLLECGVDPNLRRSEENETILNLAVRRGDLELVEMLVEHGAEINAEGTFGTAVEYAQRTEREDLVRYLKKHGARNMFAQVRGLATDEGRQSAILVRRGVEEVSRTLSGLLEGGELQRDIHGQVVRAGKECYVVYQFDGHPWTTIHPAKAKRGHSLYGPDLAERLSALLGSEAIFYGNDDSAAYVGYFLYEIGECIEDVYLGSAFAEDAFLWKPGPCSMEEDDELFRVRSDRRELTPESLEDFDFFDDFFREHDAYLPGWREREVQIGKTKKYFSHADSEVFVRVDFLRVKSRD